MTHPALPLLPWLGLGLGTLVATLAQCEPAPAPQDPPAARPAAPDATVDRVRLLVSGSMLGRLEPCGCASGQLGGLPRRMQYIGERRHHDLLLEGGDLVASATELDVLKSFTAAQVLFGMQRSYDALGIGPRDLALPLADWSAYMAGAQLVAADLECALPEWPGKPFVEKQVRGTAVRVTSFALALPPEPKALAEQVALLPPAAAWRRALDGAAPATLRVLMLHGSDQQARELVPALQPPPDLVLCFDQGYAEPAAQPERLGTVPIVYPGVRGRMLVELTLARLPDGPRLGYELVPLQGSKTLPGGGGDPDVKQMLLAHREQVKAEGVLAKMARQLPTPNGAAYLGSAQCKVCHPTAYAAWEKTGHARAWTTLEKAEQDPQRYGWPVTAYPDCVSCHVVGYREQTGFVGAEDTPHLTAVGCERCHGPGSDHVASNGKQKLGLHGGVAASVLCVQCHDFEQSPDFLYGDRWPKVAHGREPGQGDAARAK